MSGWWTILCRSPDAHGSAAWDCPDDDVVDCESSSSSSLSSFFIIYVYVC